MSDYTKDYDHEPETSGGVYLKMESGKQYRMRICGRPTRFYSKFQNNENASEKFAWPIILKTKNEDNTYKLEAKLLQGGATIFNAIKAFVLSEDWGDPETYDIIIKRVGTGLDTKYAVMPAAKVPMSVSEMAPAKALSVTELILQGPGNSLPESTPAPAPTPTVLAAEEYDPFAEE